MMRHGKTPCTRYPAPAGTLTCVLLAAGILLNASCTPESTPDDEGPAETAETEAVGDSPSGPVTERGPDSSDYVTWSIEDQPETFSPGETRALRLRLQLEPGWHVMANPASMEFLIPTELNFPDSRAATVTDTEYPEGESLEVAALDTSVRVYKDTVDIPFTLAIDEEAESGRHRITGTLRIQACDDSVCLAPATLPVELAFSVERP